MKKIVTSIAICLMLAFLASIGYAATLIVGPGEEYETIQAAIDDAVDGDTVLVKAGTYKGDGNKNLLLDQPGRVITVTSESGAFSTIIDSEGNGRGFIFLEENSVVNGFTITNSVTDSHGAGIMSNSASPVIVNNIITGNTATGSNGGGIMCIGPGAPVIIGNIITGNQATGMPPPNAGVGGGICSAGDASPIIINNTITENSAIAGGGIGCPAGSATVLNSIIWGATQGGDIFAASGRVVDISYSDLGTTGGAGTVNPGDGMLDDVDPLFVGGGDYHLDDYSPCIGAGTMTGLPAEALIDLDGDPRPNPEFTNPDIGADEHFRDIPLPVTLSAFTASSNGDKIILKWRTESELNNLGFNLYRSTRLDGDYVKVTPALIMGAGTEATPRNYSFADEDVVFGETYYYYIEDVDFSGKTNKSHIIEVTVGKQTITRIIPTKSALFQNFPNPFNPETWIPYQLAQDVSATVRIYNTEGQLIRTIDLGRKTAGTHLTKDKAIYWDGRDNVGEKVASGMYFYTLQAGKFMATRRMVIVK